MSSPWPYRSENRIACVKNWDDVHYHTPGIKHLQLPAVLKYCAKKYGSVLTWTKLDYSLWLLNKWVGIKKQHHPTFDDAPAYAAIQKMRDRSGVKDVNNVAVGYVDPDLSVNVGMLIFWAVKVAEDVGEVDLLLETLCDINNTCIQGDSHRLVVYIWGVLGLGEEETQ